MAKDAVNSMHSETGLDLKAPDFIHVNLLPIEYRIIKKDFTWLLDYRIFVSTLAVAGVLAAYVIGQSFFHANVESKKTALAKIQAEIGANAYVAAKIRELEKLRDDKTAKNNSLKSISVSKKKWVRILEGLNKSMPLNMWIESIKEAEAIDNEMELKGRTYVFPEIAEYMLELQKNEYFSKVLLNGIELQKDQNRSSFTFNIKVNLNPNVGIDNALATLPTLPTQAPPVVEAAPPPAPASEPKPSTAPEVEE